MGGLNMKFQMKDMSGEDAKKLFSELVTSHLPEEAAKKAVSEMVADLEGIEPEDMTEAERLVLTRAAENPPKFTGPPAD